MNTIEAKDLKVGDIILGGPSFSFQVMSIAVGPQVMVSVSWDRVINSKRTMKTEVTKWLAPDALITVQ